MSNIIMKILSYIPSSWQDTDQDIVKAFNINNWEQALDNHAKFLERFSWKPNTQYPKGAVLLYPFGLHTKLVSQNAGTSGSNEPTWSDASGVEGKRTINDNGIIWMEKPMEISSDTTPIGTIKQQLWNTAPPGYLRLDESHVLNRADYPELWEFVQNYAPLISEVDWQKQMALQTSVGFYSTGDGSTTFRTPILVDFARGGKDAGVYAKDQNKAHIHNVQIPADNHYHAFGYHNGNNTGRFLSTGGTTKNYPIISGGTAAYWNGDGGGGNSGQSTANLNLVTSLNTNVQNTSSNTIQTESTGSLETLPKNIIMPYFLRVKDL